MKKLRKRKPPKPESLLTPKELSKYMLHEKLYWMGRSIVNVTKAIHKENRKGFKNK